MYGKCFDLHKISTGRICRHMREIIVQFQAERPGIEASPTAAIGKTEQTKYTRHNYVQA